MVSYGLDTTVAKGEAPMAAADILDTIASMSPAQLKDVKARVTFLLGEDQTGHSSAGSKSVPENESDEVYGVVRSLLKDRGLASPPPLRVLRANKVGHSVAIGTENVVHYVREYLQPKTKTARHTALCMLVELVADRLVRKGKTVTPVSLYQGLVYVASAVEDQFLGYRASGCLPLILRVKGTSGPLSLSH